MSGSDVDTRLKLTVLQDALAVCRLPPGADLPSWFGPGPLSCLIFTDEETSLVVPESRVPDGVRAERGWRAIKVLGPLEFSLTGILSSIASPLAEAGISIFALSTYDTDYVLVQEADLGGARTVLSGDFDFES